MILGDACDTEFWLKLKKDESLELVVLAMPNHQENLFAVRQLRNHALHCAVAAIANHPKKMEKLNEMGGVQLFHMYEQAGAGLAQKALQGGKLPQ